ncbi:hypothetical protein ACI780_19205 [Geodermatophilus sp. SYSU D00814]
MASPLFSEPVSPNFGSDNTPDGAVPAAHEPAPRTTPATLDVGGEEPLVIVNFTGSLPEPSSAKTRGVLVRALETAGLLSEDGRHAVARALVQPELGGMLVKNGLLTSATVETATLDQLPGPVMTTELWPLLQPRTEAEGLPVPRPQVTGALDDEGYPMAELVLTYKNMQHLVDHLHQTITHTFHTGADYEPSILSRRVGRAVLGHVARLDFEDETPSFHVIALRDGITRWVRSISARMGGKPSADEVAKQGISDLLATQPPRAGKAPDPSIDHARGRDRVAADLRTRFTAGMATGSPTEDAVRIGQTFTMPAEIYVGVHAALTTTLPPTEVFPESIRAVVASIHTEFRGWDEAAKSIDIGERALTRALHGRHLHPDVVKLATGALGPECTSKVFGNSAIPDTALWRAVYLIHAFTQPIAFAKIKDQLRSLTGKTIIRNKAYAGYLGPLIDVPWRTTKARSLQSARRAWNGGGPVPHALYGADWEPVPTSDFLSLVPRALNGDANARRTLMVAGGVALVADGLVGSNIGSALQSGEVPFRANPNDVIAELGHQDNKAGLYQLAHAAQAFQADAAAINSFSKRDFKDGGKLPENSYAVPVVDPDQPETTLVDGTGQAELLERGEVVRLSDPERAARAMAEQQEEQARSGGFRMPEGTPGQQASSYRQALRKELESAVDLLESLLRLAATGDGAVGPALGTKDDWRQLSTMGSKISALITLNEPSEDEPHVAEQDHDEDDLVDLDEIGEDNDLDEDYDEDHVG